MIIHSYAKQSMTVSNEKKAEAWMWSHVINPINLTLRSKVKVVSGSWIYPTHRLMVIHPCAKYCKPMSNQKSYGPDTNLHRQPDGQSDSFIPSGTSLTGGIKIFYRTPGPISAKHKAFLGGGDSSLFKWKTFLNDKIVKINVTRFKKSSPKPLGPFQSNLVLSFHGWWGFKMVQTKG